MVLEVKPSRGGLPLDLKSWTFLTCPSDLECKCFPFRSVLHHVLPTSKLVFNRKKIHSLLWTARCVAPWWSLRHHLSAQVRWGLHVQVQPVPSVSRTYTSAWDVILPRKVRLMFSGLIMLLQFYIHVTFHRNELIPFLVSHISLIWHIFPGLCPLLQFLPGPDQVLFM